VLINQCVEAVVVPANALKGAAPALRLGMPFPAARTLKVRGVALWCCAPETKHAATSVTAADCLMQWHHPAVQLSNSFSNVASSPLHMRDVLCTAGL
jgi:hypothetical protein